MFTDRESEPLEVKPHSRSLGPLRKLVYKPFSQKTTFICKFCGGKSCKHENWLTYPASAIKGLNSDWITPNILATQRPSSRIIKEHDIIQAFTDAGINAIFNLQEPGEHPFCGDGIHPQSGFSYYPEEFYQHGIYYFNFGWKDMTATSTDIVLKILKQMSFSLANGNKIAIHCHAGRGRTGLIIAAWLIYSNNMTAKEAIKVVRSKRKGAIQNKAQEEVLVRLEKEIKESRLIFHSSPKFKLEDFIFHQKKLLPLSYESETRFVPNIVLVCLERLETLMNSGICTAQDVAMAFYSPNDPSFFRGEWTTYHEKALKSIKEKMNQGNFELSDIDDPRFLAQSVLDYFDHFVAPAIHSQFIDIIHQQVHNQEITKEKKDELLSKIDKKEFLLVECFTRFFSKLVDNDEAGIDHFRKAVLRICISLVLERKKWDKLFLKRSLIKEHSGDDRITYLHVFMLKWIENFSNNFTEFYMVSKSPLKINEKLIEEKMERAERRRGSYLEGAPGTPKIDLDRIATPKSGGNTPKHDRSTPRNFGTEKLKIVSQFARRGSRSHFIDLLSEEQPNQQDDTDRNESRYNPAGTSRNDLQDSDSLNTPEVRSLEHSREPSTKVLVRVHSTKLPFKHGRFTDVLESDRLPFSSFSPKVKNRVMQSAQPRVSLLRMEGNPFINNSNTQNNSSIQRNYDDFFSNNVLASEETPFQSVAQVDSDSVSDISDKDKFDEMMIDVEKLSEKKQDLLLAKLLKMKEARTKE